MKALIENPSIGMGGPQHHPHLIGREGRDRAGIGKQLGPMPLQDAIHRREARNNLFGVIPRVDCLLAILQPGTVAADGQRRFLPHEPHLVGARGLGTGHQERERLPFFRAQSADIDAFQLFVQPHLLRQKVRPQDGIFRQLLREPAGAQ